MTRATYLARKLAGQCVYSTACVRPLDEDTPWCREHRERVAYLRRVRTCKWRKQAAATSARKWRRKRAKAELCIKCPRPTRSKYLCHVHDQLHQQYLQQTAARKRAEPCPPTP